MSPLHAADGSLDPAVNFKALAVIIDAYVRPNDDIYPHVVRGVVINCVDVLALNEDDDALMGFRLNQPWKGHWHPSGGRQIHGDSYGHTGAKHLERDLGLRIAPERFELVNTASFPWSTSAQGVPCHMNGVLMAVRLSRKELDARLRPKAGDFSQSAFFPITDVTVEQGFHPAIALGVRILRYNIKQFGRLGTIPPELL